MTEHEEWLFRVIREANVISLNLWNGENPSTYDSATFPDRCAMFEKLNLLLSCCYHITYGNLDTAKEFEEKAKKISWWTGKDREGSHGR
jgi:hypothetical protein